jgi:hypothetical protein
LESALPECEDIAGYRRNGNAKFVGDPWSRERTRADEAKYLAEPAFDVVRSLIEHVRGLFVRDITIGW